MTPVKKIREFLDGCASSAACDTAYAALADLEAAARSPASANTSELDESLPPFCDGCGQEIDPETCHCGSAIGDYRHDDHDAVPMGCRCLYDRMDWAAVAKGLRARLREERTAREIPVLDARSVALWDAINAFADSAPLSDGRMGAVVTITRALMACGLRFR